MGGYRAGRGPACTRPRGFLSGYIRSPGNTCRPGTALPTSPFLHPLPSRGSPPFASKWRPHPGGRNRPRTRRPGTLPGARGQPAHTVGHLLRGREPSGHDACFSRVVCQLQGAGRGRLPRLLAGRAPGRGANPHRSQPYGRRPYAGSAQFGLLRALFPGSADGRRPCRGAGPGVQGRSRLHAHDGGRRTG